MSEDNPQRLEYSGLGEEPRLMRLSITHKPSQTPCPR